MCAPSTPACRSWKFPAVNIHHAADPLRVVLHTELTIDERFHTPSTVLGSCVVLSSRITFAVCTGSTDAEYPAERRRLEAVAGHCFDTP